MLIIHDKDTGKILQTVYRDDNIPCELNINEDYIHVNNSKVKDVFKVSELIVDTKDKKLRNKTKKEKDEERKEREASDRQAEKMREQEQSHIKRLEERLTRLEKELKEK